MQFIYVGKIVNTHGINGEVRVLSDFRYKKEIFKSNNCVYVGDLKEKLVIKDYRIHKQYDMLKFYGICDINEVLQYKGMSLFYLKDEIRVSGILDCEYIGLSAYDNDKFIGVVTEILKNKLYDILVIQKGKVRNLVPNIKEFVKNVDLENKKIYINVIEGLIYED